MTASVGGLLVLAGCASESTAGAARSPDPSRDGGAASADGGRDRLVSDGAVRPAPSFDYRSVSSSLSSLCAVATDGRLFCWGSDEGLGLLGDGLVSTHSVALPTQVGLASDWVSVESGPYVHCARNLAQETWCWGHGAQPGFGELPVQSALATPTRTTLAFERLALGEYHACGLRADGSLLCWGDNTYGQLGLADRAYSDAPVAVGSARYRSVAVGRNHSCAIDLDGALFCFGMNYSGECGQGSELEFIATPTRVGSEQWSELSCADSYCCALKLDGSAWCWGSNRSGTLGPTLAFSAQPVRIAGDLSWTRLRALAGGPCAIDQAGGVSCWGSGDSALPGDRSDASTPKQVELAAPAQQLLGGAGHRCALSGEALTCWGSQAADGVLGRGLPAREIAFVAVDDGWSKLSVTSGGGCGIGKDGALRCWGSGPHVSAPAASPIQVGMNHDWTQVALAYAEDVAQTHACAIRDSRLYCWGAGAFGQLGVGMEGQAQPVELTIPGEAFRDVAVATGFSCALTESARIYCWGDGAHAQLGNGVQEPSSQPRQVQAPTVGGWRSLSVAGKRVSALAADGTLWAWGSDASGSELALPTRLGMGTDWSAAISTSDAHSCAIGKSGLLQCTSDEPAGTLDALGADAYEAMFDAPNGVCALRPDQTVSCFARSGAAGAGHSHGAPRPASWQPAAGLGTEPTLTLPDGPISLLTGSWELRCALRPGGARLCAGRRDSFGDGSSEAQPVRVGSR